MGRFDGAKIKAMDPEIFRLVALLIAFALLMGAFLLRRKRKAIRWLAEILALALLLFKSGEGLYFLAHQVYFIPYEISHLAYWVVPFLLLLGFSGSDYAAGALAFVCGVGFLLGAAINPSDLIANMSRYEVIRLLVTHELLFFLSLLLLFDFRVFHWRDYGVYVATMLAFLTYLLLLKYRILFPSHDFSSYSIALQVMDGSLVAYLSPNPSLGLRVGFAILCIALIFLVPFALIFAAKGIFALRLRQNVVSTAEVPGEERYGLIPLLKRKKKTLA
jgi:hypothetical protein